MISADVKADVKQQEIKEMVAVLIIFTRSTFKMQKRCVFFIKIWLFYPA